MNEITGVGAAVHGSGIGGKSPRGGESSLRVLVGGTTHAPRPRFLPPALLSCLPCHACRAGYDFPSVEGGAFNMQSGQSVATAGGAGGACRKGPRFALRKQKNPDGVLCRGAQKNRRKTPGVAAVPDGSSGGRNGPSVARKQKSPSGAFAKQNKNTPRRAAGAVESRRGLPPDAAATCSIPGRAPRRVFVFAFTRSRKEDRCKQQVDESNSVVGRWRIFRRQRPIEKVRCDPTGLTVPDGPDRAGQCRTGRAHRRGAVFGNGNGNWNGSRNGDGTRWIYPPTHDRVRACRAGPKFPLCNHRTTRPVFRPRKPAQKAAAKAGRKCLT